MNTRPKKSRKPFLIIGVILLLAAAAFTVISYIDWRQERPKTVDGVKYAIQKDTDDVNVVGCDPEAASLVILPEYKGKPVTSITGWSFKGSKAQTVEIPESVKRLSWSAFEGSGIRTVTIPATVKEIGGYAFRDCSALEEVTFEDFPELDRDVFVNCPALKSVTFKKPFRDRSLRFLSGCEALEIHLPAGCKLDKFLDPPEGATLVLRDADSAMVAQRNGWTWAAEPDADMQARTLAEALEAGEVSWSYDPERNSIAVINETQGALVLEWNQQTAPKGLEADERHLFIPGWNYDADSEDYSALKPGEAHIISVDYYTEYGPGETTLEFVSYGGYYLHTQILGGDIETVETVDLEPNQRRAVTLPEGRYGFICGYGKSAEEARKNLGTSTRSDNYSYKDFPAGSRFEVSHNGTGLTFANLDKFTYGPETSALILKNTGKKACYRLYRVGGELALEEKLFDDTYQRKKITFPCGTYMLRIAEGGEWLSDEEAFGASGRYSVIYNFDFKPGETYEITTTSGSGNVHGDSAAGFTG